MRFLKTTFLTIITILFLNLSLSAEKVANSSETEKLPPNHDSYDSESINPALPGIHREKIIINDKGILYFPPSFCYLKNLRFLNLSTNKIRQIWPCVRHFKYSLEVLVLNNNQLSTLPKEFENLERLEILNLAHNLFNNFPTQFCELKSLKILNLSHNQFDKVPNEIGNLINLEELDLSNNKIVNINFLLKYVNFLR